MIRANWKWAPAALLSLVFLVAGHSTAWAQTGPIDPAKFAVDAQVEADKVHLIVTGYTKVNGEDIGPDCRADVTAVQAMFSAAFQGAWRNRLEIHPLYGNAWTAEKIRRYLRELSIGRNEVVVFYHAGHGCIQDAARPVETHVLEVNSGLLYRGEIKRLLLSHNCRGVIVLTDCCSSVPTVGRVRSINAAAEPHLNRQTVRNLFLRLRGVVDITAAEVGQNAGNTQLGSFAGAQGAFTVAFLKVASEEHVYASWQDFFPALRQMTRTSSGGRHQAQAFALRENGDSISQADMGTMQTSPLPTTGPLR